MKGYHVTTEKKIERYNKTGCILLPVRFWPGLYTAKNWAKKTGREVILKIDVIDSHPLPDHIPARFTEHIIDKWERINNV